MNFIMIGLILREALDRLCVRLNMYLVIIIITSIIIISLLRRRSSAHKLWRQVQSTVTVIPAAAHDDKLFCYTVYNTAEAQILPHYGQTGPAGVA